MMKRTRILSHLFLAVLCISALFVAVGCEAKKPVVSEAIITQPTPSTAPEAKSLDLALSVPKEAQKGDLLIAQICYSGAETAVTPPSADWVAILASKGKDSLYTVSFYKQLNNDAERENPYAFVLTGAAGQDEPSAAGKIMWFRGVDTSNPIYENRDATGEGSDLNAGGLDAKEPCLVVALFSMAGDGSGLSLPGEGANLRVRYNEATGGYTLLAAEDRVLSGASGDLSATAMKGGAWISQVIALRLAQVDVVFEAGTHGTLTKARLDRVSVSARGSLSASDIPSVNADNGYGFTGWAVASNTARLDAAGVCGLDVTGGMTLTAQYQKKLYTVKFDLGDNGKSKDCLVFSNLHYGDTIKIPAVSTRIGWTFNGWDKTPLTKVVGNATYTAKYTQNVYTVTFILGEHGASEDKLIWTGLHDLDSIIIPSVTPDSGWTFTGWDTTPATTVIGNATYTAQYSEDGYTVTFDLAAHGTSEDTLVFSGLADGDAITVPNVTPELGWEFNGWDVSPETSVYGSATYTAQYIHTPYTVVFDLGAHGHSEDQLVFENVYYGDTITIPSFTLDVGYMLIGWNIAPSTTVTEDAYYTLIYHSPPVK